MNLLFEDSRAFDNLDKEAYLIYLANKNFYKLFKKTNIDIYKDIVSMITDERTEMYSTKSIFLNNKLVGIVNFYDAGEILLRQMFGLGYLMINSEVTDKKIQDFSANLPDIEDESLYLSRICIEKTHRGMGYSSEILKFYENSALQKGYTSLSLHVHKNNKPALNAYRKFGFYIGTDSNAYLKLLKKL
jgi:ribosomal protein S18 acetylase RimI-like enzyme